MSAALRERLIALREALPELRDPNALAFAGETVLAELAALKPQERVDYAPEISGLVAALETAILTLEQRIRDHKTR